MKELLVIFLATMLTDNFVLNRFLGICPFIGVSQRTGPALGMGIATTSVMVLASVVTWLSYHLVLVPLAAEYLKIVVFIFVIAALVQLVEIFIRAYSTSLYHALGIYLPLITTNCAVLGVAFLNISESYTFFASLLSGLGAGAGFTLALLLMSAIRERLELGDVPRPLKGVPIAFITASLMSLAFLGFGSLL